MIEDNLKDLLYFRKSRTSNDFNTKL